MQYLVVLEEGRESFGAYVPDLPGCVAAGQSREEALNLIREAIEFHIEGLKQNGEPIPPLYSSSERRRSGLGGNSRKWARLFHRQHSQRRSIDNLDPRSEGAGAAADRRRSQTHYPVANPCISDRGVQGAT